MWKIMYLLFYLQSLGVCGGQHLRLYGVWRARESEMLSQLKEVELNAGWIVLSLLGLEWRESTFGRKTSWNIVRQLALSNNDLSSVSGELVARAVMRLELVNLEQCHLTLSQMVTVFNSITECEHFQLRELHRTQPLFTARYLSL